MILVFNFFYLVHIVLVLFQFIRNITVQGKFQLFYPYFYHRIYKNVPTHYSFINGKPFGAHCSLMPLLMGVRSCSWCKSCILLPYHFTHGFSTILIHQGNSLIICVLVWTETLLKLNFSTYKLRHYIFSTT